MCRVLRDAPRCLKTFTRTITYSNKRHWAQEWSLQQWDCNGSMGYMLFTYYGSFVTFRVSRVLMKCTEWSLTKMQMCWGNMTSRTSIWKGARVLALMWLGVPNVPLLPVKLVLTTFLDTSPDTACSDELTLTESPRLGTLPCCPRPVLLWTYFSNTNQANQTPQPWPPAQGSVLLLGHRPVCQPPRPLYPWVYQNQWFKSAN